MDPVLDKYLKSSVDQIEWSPEGIINFIYLGHEEVETRHGNRIRIAVYDLIAERETAIYTLAKGLIKPLFMDLKVQINDKVVIKKTGEGFQTKYEVAILERAPKQTGQAVTANDVQEVFPGAQASVTKPKKKPIGIEDAPPFE